MGRGEGGEGGMTRGLEGEKGEEVGGGGGVVRRVGVGDG